MKIKLNTANDAALFVTKCSAYPCDIDYSCGRFTIDGKSFMGVLAVGIGDWREVTIHTDCEETLNKFSEDMSMWTNN